MLTLVNILITFFILLILYQIFLANNIIEGLDNPSQTYEENQNNAIILAQKNAGNIEYLKERIRDIENVYQPMSQQIQDLSGNVASLQTQVNGLVLAQEDYINQIFGGSPPEITGL